jgi:hypothetical protein
MAFVTLVCILTGLALSVPVIRAYRTLCGA